MLRDRGRMFAWHLLASTRIGRGEGGRGAAPIAGGITRHGSLLLLLLLLLLLQLLLLMLFVLLLPVSFPLLLSKLLLCQRLASM